MPLLLKGRRLEAFMVTTRKWLNTTSVTSAMKHSQPAAGSSGTRQRIFEGSVVVVVLHTLTKTCFS